MTNLENVTELNSEEMVEIIGGGFWSWLSNFLHKLADAIRPYEDHYDPF
jgi:hypothetical protein